MNRILPIFVCALLWVQSLACVAKRGDTIVVKTIPKVECVSIIINDEIRHYLAQQSPARQECYWNITIEKDKDVCICRMFREPDFVPAVGTAYLRYGNDIIVVKGKVNRAVFRRVKGYDRSVKMSRIQRIPVDDSFSYLGLMLFNGRLSRKHSIYDSSR